jgi:hypothetical protein
MRRNISTLIKANAPPRDIRRNAKGGRCFAKLKMRVNSYNKGRIYGEKTEAPLWEVLLLRLKKSKGRPKISPAFVTP